MMRISTLLVILFITARLQAQQSMPIRMLFEPREHNFSLTGAGGGNLYGFNKASGAASGILGIDGNIDLGEKIEEKREQLKSLAMTFKLNLFNSTLLDAAEELEVRRLAFQDNDFRISMGARYNLVRQKNQKIFKPIISGFFDLIIVPYQLEGSGQDSKGFTTLSLNMGGKFGFLSKWGIGVFGITINPQFDFLFVLQSDNSFSFEEAVQTGTITVPDPPEIAKGYMAFGTKIEIPLTDFQLFFDFRKYVKIGPNDPAPELTDRLLFSFGGMSLGSIFENKKGGKKKRKKAKKKK